MFDYTTFSEVVEEKDFLKVTTEEEKCIMHFFHPDFRRCAIMDTHLKVNPFLLKICYKFTIMSQI